MSRDTFHHVIGGESAAINPLTGRRDGNGTPRPDQGFGEIYCMVARRCWMRG